MTNTTKENPVTFTPQTFQKGDAVETAHSARQVTELKFRGFKPVLDSDSPEDRQPAYEELVAQAKDLQAKGHELKASGKYDDLFEAVTKAQDDQNEIDALEVTQ